MDGPRPYPADVCPRTKIGLASSGSTVKMSSVALSLWTELLSNKTALRRAVMRRVGLVALAVLVLAALTSRPSEARSYAHRSGYCLRALHNDYSHSNNLSPYSYIYPAANWGPFFQCRMYYSPVVAYWPGLY